MPESEKPEIDVKGWVDAFYNSFLARDFLAKIIPGVIVILSFLYFACGESNSPCQMGLSSGDIEKMPLAIWLFVGGISWGVGFALQALGELFRVRAYPWDETEEDFQTRLDKFLKSGPSVAQKAQRERLVFIKEAMGNLAMATLVSTLLILARYHPSCCTVIPYVVLAAAVIALLLYYHVMHRRRQRKWELKTISDNSGKEQD